MMRTLVVLGAVFTLATTLHTAAMAQPPALRRLQAMRASRALLIQPQAIEIGVAGAFTRVEGSNSGTLLFRTGRFRAAGGGLLGAEAEVGYSHVASLDLLDAGLLFSWNPGAAERGLYPFIGVGGGVRQEWIGSFRQARYPIGGNVGLRVLMSTSALVRIEYRYRRVLEDPVADFSEHHLLTGISLLMRNGL